MTHLAPTEKNISLARAFALNRWRDRARERGLPIPDDLSSSCKFTSLFAQGLFGGRLRGNHDHQFLELPGGEILDLNAEAKDVRALDTHYRHDPVFWNNPDHRASLRSCRPRVADWLEDFRNHTGAPGSDSDPSRLD